MRIYNIYPWTIRVNVILIVTIILHKTLHEPMFIFLCSLCVNGIYGAFSFYPKILLDFSSDVSFISYKVCLGQIFALYSYAGCEFTMLAVMAYDRYVAICKPLNYHSIITPQKLLVTRLQGLRNFMSLEFLVVPPLLNPLIYGLKMSQIRGRIFGICSQRMYTLTAAASGLLSEALQHGKL
ncbi:olfactory receptor 4B13-like [Conger conger]|uniref:olfactory receptor 4B13-like n=1 Tax=Conger conger TaxID=82655 RepID=UPI002A599F50|nr:olfactory receptor 4B13-like [Conger conger]